MQRPEQLLLRCEARGPMTYAEIARLFGVTPEAIRQGEISALKKIRAALARDRKLYEDLFSHLSSEPQPRQNFYKFLREMAR